MGKRRLAALALLAMAATAQPTAGTYEIVGSTLVSAMMMFLGNENKVYILDKAEGNPQTINGHPAWGSVWDIPSRKAEVLDVISNTFCAAGMHLPNSSWAAFGGNKAVTPGPNDWNNPGPAPTYQDYDGGPAIRILNPCEGDALSWGPGNCQWYDDASVLAMQKRRWYATSEPLADGTIALIGGMTYGGFINRPSPNPPDPVTQGGLAQNSYEIYPAPPGFTAQNMDFLIGAGGLNTYAHAFLMPSGKMFLQANVSTILWDVMANIETPLPDMPGGWIRVYPASGATAMIPLTPANNYNPTIIFCGGNKLPDDNSWGGYGGPNAPIWLYPATADCQRITPEPQDGSAPVYVQDDDLPVGRTMGQFILLPDGTMLVLNGAANGTAAYDGRGTPFTMSLATNPVYQPALYTPTAPPGQRWSTAGLHNSTIPRMYHSSALLLPDASVFVAGSNPNADYNASAYYPTEARAEIFYPPYFSAKVRPVPTGIPSTLGYGGSYFNITIPPSSYTGSANSAAGNTTVVVQRGGFTTHAMNMGQRLLQLNSTFSVGNDGTITLFVSQLPPNANLFTPGPAMVFVVINGIPSNGTWVVVGTGAFGTQPTSPAQSLPQSVLAIHDTGSSGGHAGGSTSPSSKKVSAGAVIGAAVGGIAAAGALAGLIFLICKRRNAKNQRRASGISRSFDPSEELLAKGAYRPGSGTGSLRGGDGVYSYPPYRYNDSQQSSAMPGTPVSMAKPLHGTTLHGGSSAALLPEQEYNPYRGGGAAPGIGAVAAAGAGAGAGAYAYKHQRGSPDHDEPQYRGQLQQHGGRYGPQPPSKGTGPVAMGQPAYEGMQDVGFDPYEMSRRGH